VAASVSPQPLTAGPATRLFRPPSAAAGAVRKFRPPSTTAGAGTATVKAVGVSGLPSTAACAAGGYFPHSIAAETARGFAPPPSATRTSNVSGAPQIAEGASCPLIGKQTQAQSRTKFIRAKFDSNPRLGERILSGLVDLQVNISRLFHFVCSTIGTFEILHYNPASIQVFKR
jgi:hypothetical protein